MADRDTGAGSGRSDGSGAALGVAPGGLPAAGELLGGRFRLVRALGAGATGVVFEAVDEVGRQRIALKVLRPEAVLGSGLERLRREVRLSRPGHPHVVRLNDLHEADGFLLLSMELVEGESLAARLEGGRRLSIGEVVSLGRQVAGALTFLHGSGLVHRDVKPGNLLLDGAGGVKLCDLGLLRPVDHGLTLTVSELVVGTPAYMAPEQATGKELTGAADVYGLGLTLWQAVAGTVPLSGSTAVETLTRRQKESPPRLRPLRPEAPRWLERLLRRMLAPRPAERPTAAAVETALGAARFRPGPPPRTLAAAGVALAVVAALALSGRALLQRRTERYESAGNLVRGVDGRGRETFRHELGSTVRQLVVSDLDGDAAPEAVAAAWPDEAPSSPGRGASEVVVLDLKGRLRSRLRPEEAVEAWSHPFTRSFRSTVSVLDLDGDGPGEVVVRVEHRTFYPAALFVYWPKADLWEQVLDHWGHVYFVSAVAGASPRLRFLAVNNALGFANVFGEVELAPPARRQPGAAEGPLLTALPALGSRDATGRWLAYTLLPVPSAARLTPDGNSVGMGSDGGTRIRFGFGDVVLDRNGNPSTGPNAGRDLSRLRLEFATAGVLVGRGPSSPAGAGAILGARAQLAERFAPLLAEAPYRLAFDLEFARQLASAGAPGRAARLLGEAAREAPGEEVSYQRAGFLALAGELEEAAGELTRLYAEGAGTRIAFDVPSLLLRVAVERGIVADVETSIAYLANDADRRKVQPGLAATLRCRARLLRDRIVPEDEEVRSWPWASDGDALAVLARWRLGRSRPGDVAAMEAFLPVAGDGAREAELALAAALLASGRPGEAARRARGLVESLDWEARRSLERRQQLLLARGILAKALVGSGRVDEALATASALRDEARPGLLSSNLAAEVLAAAR